MKLPEKDLQSLAMLYEQIKNSPARFDNVDPQRVRLIQAAEEKLSKAIRNIQNTDVFFSGVLDRMIPNDPNQMVRFSTKTMATDGKLLLYNPEFVNKIALDMIETVVVHEILHVALGHHVAFADVPMTNRDLRHLVNVACDLAINHLISNRAGVEQLLQAGEGEYADFPQGKDAREYYQMLIDRYRDDEDDEEGGQGGQGGQGGEGGEEGGQGGEEGGQGGEGGEEGGQGGQGGEEGGEEGGQGGQGGEGGEEGGQGGEEGGQGGEGGEGGEEGGQGGEEGGQGGEGGEEGGQGGPRGKGGKGGKEGGEGGDDGDFGTPGGQSRQDGKSGQPKEGGQGGQRSPTGKTGKQPSLKDQPKVNVPQHIIDQYQKFGEVNTPDNVTQKNQQIETAKHEQDMREEIQTADELEKERRKAGIASAGYGGGSGRFARGDYRDLFKQKSNLPWNQILANFLTNPEKSDRSYRVANRRFMDFYNDSNDADIIMPGYRSEKLKELTFLVDVSGSMPRSTCQKVFGEIAAVSKLRIFGQGSMIRLLTFDDDLMSEEIFTGESKAYRSLKNPSEKVPKENIYKLPLQPNKFSEFRWTQGGGGTQIGKTLATITKAVRPLPELVIILTDGWFVRSDMAYLQTAKFPFKVIWLMTTDISYPVGKTYKLSDYNYFL